MGWGKRVRAVSVLVVGLCFASTVLAADRVVSLGGDITGIIYSLGAGEKLVGVDSTSTWPLKATKLPNVGYVRQLSTEGVLALNPNLIIATHAAGPPTVIKKMQQLGANLVVLPVTRKVDGILHKITRIGDLLQKPKRADSLRQTLRKQADQLATQRQAMAYHPRAVFILSAGGAGLMVAGQHTAANAALRLAGAKNVVTGYSGYKPLSAEALIKLKPDVLVMMDTGDGELASDLLLMPAIKLTPAGRHQRVIQVDGEALLGFGVRTLKAASKLQRQLAQVKQP